MKKVCILPGEGIGPEVIREAVRVLEALPIKLEFDYGEIGFETFKKTGSALPKETIERVGKSDATLFGAVTTPPNLPNYSSPILALRKHFDLYANVRPCRGENANIVIVRENTEGLYSGIERVEENGDKAISERIITRKGSLRIAEFAFRLAEKKGHGKVTIVHKANVLRESCGLFRKTAFEVAKEHPNIQAEEMLVDNCAMQLVANPAQFEVIVTTNLFGDILSDVASMVSGGLGTAYSGNIGEKRALFEPVHGSAPTLAGTRKANPVAAILSAKMMLEFLGFKKEAATIEQAVNKAIQKKETTPDLGGTLSTKEAANAVIQDLG